MNLEEIKAAFGGEMAVVKGPRCFEAISKREILPPLHEPISELIQKNLIFEVDHISICTTEKALDASKRKQKCLLTEAIRIRKPYFDFSKSLLDWCDPPEKVLKAPPNERQGVAIESKPKEVVQGQAESERKKAFIS